MCCTIFCVFQQYAAEKVMTAKHSSETAKKDKEIEFLKATVKKLEVRHFISYQ